MSNAEPKKYTWFEMAKDAAIVVAAAGGTVGFIWLTLSPVVDVIQERCGTGILIQPVIEGCLVDSQERPQD